MCLRVCIVLRRGLQSGIHNKFTSLTGGTLARSAQQLRWKCHSDKPPSALSTCFVLTFVRSSLHVACGGKSFNSVYIGNLYLYLWRMHALHAVYTQQPVAENANRVANFKYDE